MKNILLIDKPKDWTSFDVVARIRGEIRKKLREKSENEKANSQEQIANRSDKRVRVGHAGTLDPFATGLLIVLVGEATKEQDKFMKLDKEYEATLKLGFESTTGDPEGEISEIPNPKFQIPNKNQINNVLNKFLGEQEQTPPAYSAIKINGQRAYKLARAGKEFEIKSRTIVLYSSVVMDYKYPKLKIKVNCSSGTYIRVLAEDIGKELGCGAYLTELRRTKIGKFDIKNAKTIKEVIQFANKSASLAE